MILKFMSRKKRERLEEVKKEIKEVEALSVFANHLLEEQYLKCTRDRNEYFIKKLRSDICKYTEDLYFLHRKYNKILG